MPRLTTAVWAAEIKLWDSIAAAEITLYVASSGSFTVGGLPATSQFLIVLEQPALAARTAFDDHRTIGEGRPSVGRIALRSSDGTLGTLDKYRFYGWDGRAFTLKLGTIGGEYNTGFTTVLSTTMESAVAGQEDFTIALRDWSRSLDLPFLTTFFAGTNSPPNGLEGTADLAGKPKPDVLGAPRNVELICVNPSKLIYQARDGALSGVPSVYDEGIPLGVSFPLASRSVPSAIDTWRDIAEGGNVHVAVGNQAGVGMRTMRSTDGGVTWAAQSIGGSTSDVFFRIIYVDPLGKFVASGTSGRMYTSSDLGVTWVAVPTNPFSGTASITSLAFSPTLGLLTACANTASATEYATSTTATSWASHTITTDFWGPQRSVWGKDRFVLVGIDFTHSVGLIAYSLDGLTYVKVTSALGASILKGLAYSPTIDRYVASSDVSANLQSSEDAITWTERPGDGVVNPWSVVSGPSGFLAISLNVQALTSSDGMLFTAQTSGLAPGATFLGAVIVGTNVVAVGLGSAFSTIPPGTYANTTDLQDESLAPLPGTYKVCLSTGHVRVGSSPAGRLTCDPVQGASGSNRTAAQLFVQVLQKAGFTSGDWSASDITALDAANGAPLGYYTADTSVTFSNVLDLIAASVGAWWSSDAQGVIRVQRLENPDDNCVTNPDAITAAAGWTLTGSVVGTAAFSSVNDVPLTRLAANNTGLASRTAALVGNGIKRFGATLRYNGVPGTTTHGLFDTTAAGWLALIVVTWAADGTATVVVSVGTLVRFAALGGNAYRVVVTSTSATAAHTNTVYANGGSATATSIDIGRVTVNNTVPDATLSQDNMNGMVQVDSSDDDKGVPCNSVTVRYSRNYSPLSNTDLAAGVSDSAKSLFSKEWLASSTTPDAGIIAAHPLSVPRIVETLLTTKSDADTEASRLQALFGVKRYWFDVPMLFLTDENLALELGRVADVVSSRHGMAGGIRHRVMGIKPNAAANNVAFSVWG